MFLYQFLLLFAEYKQKLFNENYIKANDSRRVRMFSSFAEMYCERVASGLMNLFLATRLPKIPTFLKYTKASSSIAAELVRNQLGSKYGGYRVEVIAERIVRISVTGIRSLFRDFYILGRMLCTVTCIDKG